MRTLSLALVAGLFVFATPPFLVPAAEPEVKTLEIGAAAPDFSLPGVDGKSYGLKDFAQAKLLLVVFTCNHCPTAQAYEPRIIKLAADYREQGVAVVAISPNDDAALRLDELGYTDVGDSLADMQHRAKEHKFAFPYLYDGETQQVARAYGAVATPHVFLFDAERKLRYTGRIDDSDVKEVKSHDTRNAIDSLLAGQPVAVEKTRTFGCSVKWSEKRGDVKTWLDKVNQEPVELKSIDEAALARLVKNDTENLLLVNLWATWCGPCVAELPQFTDMHRMYRKRKFQLVTISLDEPEAKADALKLLQERRLSATNFLSAIEDKDKLADALDKDWNGALPHTVLIAPGGKILFRQNGPIKPLETRRAIVEYLGRTYAPKITQ